MNTIPETFRKKAILLFHLIKSEVAIKTVSIRGLALKLSLFALACLTTETATAAYMKTIGQFNPGEKIALDKSLFSRHLPDGSDVMKIGTKVLNGHLYIYRRGARGPSSCYMEVIEVTDFKGQPFRIRHPSNQQAQLIFLREDAVTRTVSCVDTGCDSINQIIEHKSTVPVTAACDITGNNSMQCACHIIKKDKRDKSVAMPTGLKLCKTIIAEKYVQASTWLIDASFTIYPKY